MRSAAELEDLMIGLTAYRELGPRVLYTIGTHIRVLVNNYLLESGEKNG